MLARADDRTYERFWRQAARWLATPAPDPVSVVVPAAAEPGGPAQIEVEARDAAFVARERRQRDGDGDRSWRQRSALVLRRDPEVPGRFVGQMTPDVAGLYRVQGEARRGMRSLGQIDAWFHVGGVDREFADPRLNEGFLRRLAYAIGRRVPSRPATPAGCRRCCARRRRTRSNRNGATSGTSRGPSRSSSRCSPPSGSCVAVGVFDESALHAGVACLLLIGVAGCAAADRYAVVVTGASGGAPYAEKYDAWRNTFVATLETKLGYPRDHIVVLAEEAAPPVRRATRDEVRAVFQDLAMRVAKDDVLLVLLIGHGTSGDEGARFNLVGPDLTAAEWAGARQADRRARSSS